MDHDIHHHAGPAGFPAELSQLLKKESEFAHINNLENPSRYGRNEASEEKIRQQEQVKAKSRQEKPEEYFRFPESGVNSDRRGLHGVPEMN